VAEAVDALLMVRVKVPLTMPVPVRGTTSGEVVAELVTVRVALRAPIAVGVKVTVTVQLAPGAKVVRLQGTVMAKSPGDVARARLVMGALPVLVRVKERMAGEPTAMLPKLSVAGAIWRWDWAPMPVRAAVSGMFEAEVARKREPVRVPVWMGVNDTWRVQLEATGRVPPGAGQEPVDAV
jgi:hypothetical protein